MTPAHAGDLLHGLDARTQCGCAPSVQELAGPSRRGVLPELLEVFLQQIGADTFEVIAQQLFESPLVWGVVRFSERFKRHQRDFFRTGSRPLRTSARASSARTSSKASYVHQQVRAHAMRSAWHVELEHDHVTTSPFSRFLPSCSQGNGPVRRHSSAADNGGLTAGRHRRPDDRPAQGTATC